MARTGRLRAGWGWVGAGTVVCEKKTREGTSNPFFKKSPPPFLPRPPRRRASKVRRCCTFCQRYATAAPARTPAPVPFLWDPRAARSFAFAHAASEGELGFALQQCSRSCTPSANQLQLQCTAKTPLAGSPRPVCDARSHDPFAAPVSGAAASTRSELRHALHTARARPPGTRTAPAPPRALLPKRELTRNLRTGRFRGRRDSGVGVERRCEVRGSKKSLCTHKHRVPRAHPLPPRVTPGITDNRCPHARP